MRGRRDVRVGSWCFLGVVLVGACSGREKAPPATQTTAAPAAPFVVADVVRRARQAFIDDGGVFTARSERWAARVDTGGALTVRAATPDANAFTVATVGMGPAGRPALAGSLVQLARTLATERFRNADEGVEQTWTFDRRPAARSVTVKVKTSGARFVRAAEDGLHFAAATVGFRYGMGTWVDARGTRTTITPRFEDGHIHLTVPAHVLDRSAYPAVLDPFISPEFPADQPVVSQVRRTSWPTVATDGTNHLVVWRDHLDQRFPASLRASRVSATGELLDAQSIDLSRAVAADDSPYTVVFDGVNYAVFFDRGEPTGRRPVVLHVSPAGEVIEPEPVPFTRPGGMAFDLFAGHYVFAWHDSAAQGIRVQRYSRELTPVGASQVIPTSSSVYPVVASVRGEVLVAFDLGGNIHAARVSPGGGVTGPVALVATAEIEWQPRISHDGAGFAVAWERNGGFGGFAFQGRTVGADLTLGPVTTLHAPVTPGPTWVFTGGGGRHVLAMYNDMTPPARNVIVKRLGADLSTIRADQIPVGVAGEARTAAAITESGATLVAWAEGLFGGRVFARAFSPAGGPVGTTNLDVARHGNEELAPTVATDGTRYLVAWADGREQATGNFATLYATVVDGQGSALGPPSGIRLGVTIPRKAAVAAFDGTDFVVAWTNTSSELRAARVTTAAALRDPGGRSVHTAVSMAPAELACARTGVCMAGWIDGSGAFWARRMAGVDGTIGDAFRIAPWGDFVVDATLATNGSAFLAVWRTQGSPSLIRSALVSPAGVVTLASPTIAMAATDLAAASNGTDYLVTWSASGVKGALVAGATGAIGSPFAISSTTISVQHPAVGFDGTNYLVAWSQTEVYGFNDDLWGAWVSPAGAIVSPGPVVLSACWSSEWSPAIASPGDGRALVAYARMTTPAQNWRILARFVSREGTSPPSCSDGATPDVPDVNDPPVVAARLSRVEVNEGQLATNDGTYSDPDVGATVSLAASTGTVSKAGTDGWVWQLATADGTGATTRVTITAKDQQDATGTAGFDLVVSNVPPTAGITGAPASVVEGTLVSLGSTATDPSAADTAAGLARAWSVTRDGVVVATGAATALSFLADDDGTYVVTLVVTDKDGGQGTASVAIDATNAAPALGALAGAEAPVAIGTAVTLAAVATDVASDPLTCTFAWGDGTSTTAAAAGGECRATHAYAAAGAYVPQLTAVDDGGASAAASASEALVVYDPASAIAGGAQIDSPEGALPAAPTAAGRARLVVTARYSGGDPLPRGRVSFELPRALAFAATSFDWLLTTGGQARLQGRGTVDGAGYYRFLLTIADGVDAQRLRMQIWDVATGAVIYDNGAPAVVTGRVTVSR